MKCVITLPGASHEKRVLKLIDGYPDENEEFLLGNVHRKALASKHMTCCWLNDNLKRFCLFKSGTE